MVEFFCPKKVCTGWIYVHDHTALRNLSTGTFHFSGVTLLAVALKHDWAECTVHKFICVAYGKLRKEYIAKNRAFWRLFDIPNAGYGAGHHRLFVMECDDPIFNHS
eukprot:6416374-Ditylum_brightwellii.AAC.1